jgi:glutamate N-acetyltransferase/amino-acid N-acetyltransferase
MTKRRGGPLTKRSGARVDETGGSRTTLEQMLAPGPAPAPVAGFRWASVAAGIKKRGGLDLALLVAERPVSTAAVFTRSLVKAAPVLVAAERVKRGLAQAVLINAGCANAATGKPGLVATRESSAAVARALGIDDALVVPMSTGVIGVVLPAERIVENAAKLVAAATGDGLEGFSRAIMTTDRGPKLAEAEARVGGKRVRVVGVAKGAGMIHPDMATTLACVVTDARISPALLRRALREATDATFNALTVDGDTSTNDTIVAMASGAVGNAALRAGDRGYRAFTVALTQVLAALGRMIVADGEGAEHLVTVRVEGAPSAKGAVSIARTIATSNLVKTALYGKDPNWGRVLAAAGRARVKFDPARAELLVGEVALVSRGVACGGDADARAHAVMLRPEYQLTLRLGAGGFAATYLMCDLGPEYVRINADYRS